MKLTIDHEDELTHDHPDTRAWRESYWIDVMDKQTGTGVLMYFSVRPGQELGHGFINIATRDGSVLYAYHDFSIPVLGHLGDQDSLQVGPFSVVNGTPLETQSFHFSHEGTEVEIEFESDASILDYPWPWTNSRHWEQVGTGSVTAKLASGETIAVKGTSARDHAWGSRQALEWHGFYWITCRALEDGPSWTMCWLNTTERRQVLGYLVEPNGETFLGENAVCDVEYDDGVPESCRLKMEFGGYWNPVEAELDLYGPINLSSLDPEKQGGYFFSFAAGRTNGKACQGTFDIFWREGLDPIARFPFTVST